MNTQVLDFLLSIILTIAGLVIGVLFGMLKAKARNERQKDKAIENGMYYLLREKIIEICDRCIERGFVHIHSLESLDDLSKQYKALGGNGTAAKLIEDVKKLQVK